MLQSLKSSYHLKLLDNARLFMPRRYHLDILQRRTMILDKFSKFDGEVLV